MAICLIKKGGGGIQSEDTTAVRADVLVGKTALTADSNDEALEGTMQLLSANSDISLSVMFAHNRTDNWGEGGAIDSPSKGRGIIISMRPEDTKKYALDNSVAFVFMPAQDLRAENIRSGKTIAKVQGAIPIWNVAGSGYLDMLYAWADQGHAIDHPIAGRGVVSKIPNGHIIEGANWVFLKAPTLLPENVRQGIDILGIQGTLPDYSAGRVAFNNATFDGTLLSGVAVKDKEVRFGEIPNAFGNIAFSADQWFTTQSDAWFKYLGIRDGGLRFSVINRKPEIVHAQHNRNIAVFFDSSINMIPFKKIKVGAKFLSGQLHNSGGTSDNPSVRIGLVIVPTKNIMKRTMQDYYTYQVSSSPAPYVVKHVSFSLAGSQINTQLWAEIDVSDMNEQCYIFAYANASAEKTDSIAQAECVINYIEFIN
jgi:hypothetical protein